MHLKILDFLQHETHALDRKLFLLTAVSGIANAFILAIINSAAESIAKGGPHWRHYLLFTLSILLFAYSLRYVLFHSSRIAEEAICSVRVRLADKIRHCNLLALESIGEADIHARISRETSLIAQAALPLFGAGQSFIMVLFTMGYIAIISPMAVLVCLAMIAGGVSIYLKDRKIYEDGLQETSRSEEALFTSLTGLLKGFKELRINKLKSDDVFEEFGATAATVRDGRFRVIKQFTDNVVFAQTFFMLLVGAIVFVLPVLSTSFSDSVTKIVAAVLFLIGPLSNVVMTIPILSQTHVTVDNLRRLEGTLDDALADSLDIPDAALDCLENFHTIRFENVGFIYNTVDGTSGFQIGPINEEVRRGEILFMVGGNGSGKTTFMKLFTALYQPMQGSVRVDDVEIVPANVQSYRNLFSAIFSDFHLFEKLHGLRNADPERVAELLRLMEISDKTDFSDGYFSNTRLSTGQRKRLALVVAYLEDKAVYVFDEVAADQDPRFRRYFYETLLPELKQAGKTVVVVSHDDRYVHVADRVIEMDYGKFNDMSQKGKKPSPQGKPSRRAAKPTNEQGA